MFNLLKGELYKLWRSKSLYICSIVMLVFLLLIYGMFSLVDMMQQGELANGSYGLTVDGGVTSVWDEMGISDIIKMMFTTVSTFIIVIFVSIYVFADYANGAIKNVVGKGYSRGAVFLSKLIGTVVGTVVMQVVMILGLLACEELLLGGKRLNADVMVDIGGYIGMQLLFGVALTVISVTISQICRNLGVAIAISTCMIMFSFFATAGINALLKFMDMNVNVCEYWILDLISECPIGNMDNSFLIRAVVSAIVWIVVAIGIGGIHFRKADVK